MIFFYCNNTQCTDSSHLENIDKLFKKAVKILLFATEEYTFEESGKFRVIPGWNDSVRELYAEAKVHFQTWKNNGRPQLP